MIEKNYQPADIEGRISRSWEQSGAFKAGRPDRRYAKPFTIVIPPPNVTGSLHMGHALNITLQDILWRVERMRGRDVLWQPGTDHAGIAPQMVVGRQRMERQGPGRRDTAGRDTMLGDPAVAWHPEDERYAHLVGKHVIVRLVGRKIPIVADEYSDPEKGSGAVKVTPAHDFNDFEVGRRHNLPQISVLDQEGRLALVGNEDYLRGLPEGSEQLAQELHGVDRFAARKLILARLEDFGFLERIEPNTHVVPHGDRSGVVIEPYLTDQWYVDAKTLAQPAIAAGRSGATSFGPKNWAKTYFQWMETIPPRLIPRPLCWRLP